MSLDPERRALLEEERDFLLTSLRDLDQERAAGDVDDVDYRNLHAGYTARAAAVLRALAGDGDGPDGPAAAIEEPVPVRPTTRRTGRGRRLGVLGGVVLLAVVAGLGVTRAAGRRSDGGAATGADVRSASARITSCREQEQAGDEGAALECYSSILEVIPDNVDVLSARGWLQVREGELEAGLEDLDRAVALAPSASAPRIFRSVARLRDGQAVPALADLVEFYEGDPPEEQVALAKGFAPRLAEAALDDCVAGDVSGERAPRDLIVCYRGVLTIDPGNAAAEVYLGWLLARAGQIDLARSLLDDGIAHDPDAGQGYVFRAALRAHAGDLDGARADLAAFDALATKTPAQQAAADEVRAAIEAGRDPLR